eukprot:12910033-Prorocentrum_lima.AAC.1
MRCSPALRACQPVVCAIPTTTRRTLHDPHLSRSGVVASMAVTACTSVHCIGCHMSTHCRGCWTMHAHSRRSLVPHTRNPLSAASDACHPAALLGQNDPCALA